jgi:hypothetical protein
MPHLLRVILHPLVGVHECGVLLATRWLLLVTGVLLGQAPGLAATLGPSSIPPTLQMTPCKVLACPRPHRRPRWG